MYLPFVNSHVQFCNRADCCTMVEKSGKIYVLRIHNNSQYWIYIKYAFF